MTTNPDWLLQSQQRLGRELTITEHQDYSRAFAAMPATLRQSPYHIADFVDEVVRCCRFSSMVDAQIERLFTASKEHIDSYIKLGLSDARSTISQAVETCFDHCREASPDLNRARSKWTGFIALTFSVGLLFGSIFNFAMVLLGQQHPAGQTDAEVQARGNGARTAMENYTDSTSGRHNSHAARNAGTSRHAACTTRHSSGHTCNGHASVHQTTVQPAR